MLHLLAAVLFSVAVCASDESQLVLKAKLPEVVWLGGIIPYKIDKDFKNIDKLFAKINNKSDVPITKSDEKMIEKPKFSEYEAVLEHLRQSFGSTVDKLVPARDLNAVRKEKQTTSSFIRNDFTQQPIASTKSASAIQGENEKSKIKLELSDEPEYGKLENTSNRTEKRKRGLKESEDKPKDDLNGKVNSQGENTKELSLRSESDENQSGVSEEHKETENEATNQTSTSEPTKTAIDSFNIAETLVNEAEDFADPFAGQDISFNEDNLMDNRILQDYKDKKGSSAIKTHHKINKQQKEKQDEDGSDENVNTADCSSIKFLLEPVIGSHSLFEESLKNGSNLWTQGQKIGFAKLLRRIHMVISLYRNDRKRQFQIVRDVIKMYIAREPNDYKERVLNINVISLGKLHDFISCSWQD